MSEIQKITNKFYFPSCKECNGLLSITINPLNFSIDCQCEKNEMHNKEYIYFKTFEKFYLKEQELYKCSKCGLNLDNSEFCKCETCKLVYCCKCILDDIKINNHKNIIFETNNQKCVRHNWNYNSYCLNCKKNICLNCTKSDYCHQYHSIKNFSEIMPSAEHIENLKLRLNNKIKYTNFLIKKIENWKKKIINKTEELKQNLINEISFFSKVIFNYNNSFADYTYFNFFNSISNYIQNINNEYLLKFFNSNNFESQTEIMNNLFKYLGKRKKKEEITKKLNQSLFNIYSNKNTLLEKINGLYFIIKDNYNNNISLCNYTVNNNYQKININRNIEFKDQIYSISKSTIENTIFACLLNSRKVKIFDYDIKSSIFVLNKNEISDEGLYNHFNKCIQIKKNYYVTSDNRFIIIWQNLTEQFLQIQKTEFSTKSIDLLLVNEDFFISSQPDYKMLTLFSTEKLTPIKIIKNIDCIDSTKCLFKIKDEHIIIGCKKGFGLFLIKTKELIQYIEFLDNNYNKIYCDYNNIYLLNVKRHYNSNSNYSSSNNNDIKIMVANIVENEVIYIKEINNLSSNEEQLEITSLSNDIILLWKDNIYLCKEKINQQFNSFGFY